MYVIKRATIIKVLSGILGGFIVAFIFFGPMSSKLTANSNIKDWGLSYKKDNMPPIGNKAPEYLKPFNSYFIGDTNEKCIYLTFDAGFENGYTSKVLDVLKENDVKATFFVVGNYIKTSPDLIKRMVAEGHIVGNHTNSHPDMSKISDLESFKNEILTLETMYKDVIGKEMEKFYRPPQGKFSESNLMMAHDLGYKTIFWSLAYVDWYENKQATKEEAFKKLMPRIHNGAVVLLHNTSKTNSEIVDELIKSWKKEGYTFKSLHDLK